MEDLATGIIILIGISIVAFVAAFRVGLRSSDRVRLQLAFLASMGVVGYTVTMWDDVLLAQLLPFSNLIIVGNWFPVGAAILGGLMISQTRWLVRPIMTVAVLGFASLFSVAQPFFGDVPKCRSSWTPDGICLQTTDATCSAACAATLLKMHGIETTEQEMADLCLTRSGTRWQGLYRALKRKTERTAWDVEALDTAADGIDDLLDTPLIAAVGISPSTETAGHLRDEWGWKADRGHSVIVAGPGPAGFVKVIDPDPEYVRRLWSPQTLSSLWQSRILRLVPRQR